MVAVEKRMLKYYCLVNLTDKTMIRKCRVHAGKRRNEDLLSKDEKWLKEFAEFSFNGVLILLRMFTGVQS